MNSQEFHLYRAKFIKPNEPHLFDPDISPAQIFHSAITECPEYQVNEDLTWHIGNVDIVSETTGTFAVGKTARKTAEKYDEDAKEFYLTDEESSPYTNVLFDSALGILGIKKKTVLAAHTKQIAHRLRQLFASSNTVKDLSIDVKVEHIPDPTDFITKIRSAYAIRSFKSTFTGPNPIDADEIFQKPLSVYCQSIGGENGAITVYGKSLTPDVVESIAHSSAATANNVTAKIQQHQNSKPLPISFKGDPTRLVANSDLQPSELIYLLQQEYLRVRG